MKRNIILINAYTIEEFKKLNYIKFSSPIQKNNFKYLKFINKNAEVSFEHNNFNNIFDCIKYIKNDNITIKILYNDKEKFNEILLNKKINKYNLKNVKIMIKEDLIHVLDIVSLKDYLKYEKELYDMIKPVINLSPLEKYIYIYNLVKNFKEYKESNIRNESRYLYKILNNEYIVCVGYAVLLKDLLKKSGINSIDISIKVDSSYDDKELNKVKLVKKEGHRRLYVYLKDNKYKIDGYYLSDPTWDNNLDEDYYNHMLFTDEKNNISKEYQWLDRYILFNIKNKYEFNKYFDLSNNILDFSSYYCNYRLYIIDFILNIINNLEPKYFLYLKEKYKCIHDTGVYKINPNYEELIVLKDELSEHILNRVNKEINDSTIWKGIREVYRKKYGYKKKWLLDCKIELLKMDNKENEKECFLERKLIR